MTDDVQGDEGLGAWLTERIRVSGAQHGANHSDRTGAQRSSRRPRVRPTEMSASAPDSRDPQLASSVLSSWMGDHGYRDDLAAGTLQARWEFIAGPDLAEHVTADVMDTSEGRILHLQADSTTWATQLTLLLPELKTRIEQVVGADVIDQVRISGPAAPTTKGRLRVKGLGPRDTYG